MANSIREIMEQRKFKYSRTCHCNGARTLVYTKGELEFRWRINKATFRLREGRLILKGWMHISKAEEVLNEYDNDIS